MEAFSSLLALCEVNPPVTGGFPSQRPVTRNIGVFFDLRLSEWLSKLMSILYLLYDCHTQKIKITPPMDSPHKGPVM